MTGSFFDVEPMRRAREKRPVVRSVAQGNCPECTREKVGLVRQGIHIVWREHNLTTWAGTRIACRASGVAACVLTDGTVRCPHER